MQEIYYNPIAFIVFKEYIHCQLYIYEGVKAMTLWIYSLNDIQNHKSNLRMILFVIYVHFHLSCLITNVNVGFICLCNEVYMRSWLIGTILSWKMSFFIFLFTQSSFFNHFLFQTYTTVLIVYYWHIYWKYYSWRIAILWQLKDKMCKRAYCQEFPFRYFFFFGNFGPFELLNVVKHIVIDVHIFSILRVMHFIKLSVCNAYFLIHQMYNFHVIGEGYVYEFAHFFIQWYMNMYWQESE